MPDKITHLSGDNPKLELANDAFGLSDFAHAIADVERSRMVVDGYAFGIEGPWGSGKSTLLNFVEELLTHQVDEHGQVVRFEPWLVGRKEALLTAFFTQLTSAIENLRQDLESNNLLIEEPKSAFDRLRTAIAKYTKHLGLIAEGGSFQGHIRNFLTPARPRAASVRVFVAPVGGRSRAPGV